MHQNYLSVDGIFEKEELSNFIKKFDALIPKKQLGVLGEKNPVVGRIAEGIWIKEYDKLAERMKFIIAGVTGLPIENQEDPHLIKYETGGEYKHHHDYFMKGEQYYEKSMYSGGQRVFSTILYLNDNFVGGETDFPKYNLTVKPKTGLVFTWRNLNLDGSVNQDSLHGGLPVTEGKKYIIVVWTRENSYLGKAKPINLKTTTGLKL